MRRTLFPLVLLALAGCEAVEMLTNDKVLAGALLATPDVEMGSSTVPGAVTAHVFFGQISGAMSGAADVDPISGATVQLTWTGGGSATLSEVEAGYYQATGGSLVYTEGADYTFRVTYQGETYSGTVEAPPLVEMRDPEGSVLGEVVYVDDLELEPSYPICREGSQDAFVTVVEVGTDGSTGAQGAMALLFDPSAYREACFDVPATCFPNRSDPETAGYAIGLTALNKAVGTAMSSNLFLGSGVFAGTMDASALVLGSPP
jgi:hypothetical protein